MWALGPAPTGCNKTLEELKEGELTLVVTLAYSCNKTLEELKGVKKVEKVKEEKETTTLQ